MNPPCLPDRAAGAVVAALLCSPEAAEELVSRLEDIGDQAGPAVAALSSASVEERDPWTVRTLGRLTQVPALDMPHVHPSWIASALAAGPPGAREAIASGGAEGRRLARALLGRLPSPGPLPAPLEGIAPGDLHAVTLALGARRIALALLPAGRAYLAAAAARLGSAAAWVLRAAAHGQPKDRATPSARDAIDEVRPALGLGAEAPAWIGVRRIARMLAASPDPERAIHALPRPVGDDLRRALGERPAPLEPAAAAAELAMARAIAAAAASGA